MMMLQKVPKGFSCMMELCQFKSDTRLEGWTLTRQVDLFTQELTGSENDLTKDVTKYLFCNTCILTYMLL